MVFAEASLSTAKFSLSAAGAQEGELLRLALGDEAFRQVQHTEVWDDSFLLGPSGGRLKCISRRSEPESLPVILKSWKVFLKPRERCLGLSWGEPNYCDWHFRH